MATDYISREAAIEKITALINESGKYTAYESGADDACYIVEHEIPAADVVEVVRCKDCQHYNPEATEWRCNIVTGLVEPYDDDFCSYGARRTENG